MKRVTITFLLLTACLFCACNKDWQMMDRRGWGDQKDYTVENYTIKGLLDGMQEDGRFTHLSFSVRNDRKFKRLKLKNVLSSSDLFRELKSATNCEITKAGRSVLITLPKIE